MGLRAGEGGAAENLAFTGTRSADLEPEAKLLDSIKTDEKE